MKDSWTCSISTPTELLSTTRAGATDSTWAHPVPGDTIRERVAMALQAHSGGNEIVMRFLVVGDPATIEVVGDVYAQCWTMYERSPQFAWKLPRGRQELRAQQGRVVDSAAYRAQHMGTARCW